MRIICNELKKYIKPISLLWNIEKDNTNTTIIIDTTLHHTICIYNYDKEYFFGLGELDFNISKLILLLLFSRNKSRIELGLNLLKNNENIL